MALRVTARRAVCGVRVLTRGNQRARARANAGDVRDNIPYEQGT